MNYSSLLTTVRLDNELLKLNDLWSRQILPQINKGKDLIVLEFARRKRNPQPYKSIIPAYILQKFRNIGDRPFKTGGGKDVDANDLNYIWQSARSRSKIGKNVKLHDLQTFGKQ